MSDHVRFMGDFVGGPLESLCVCGHDVQVHETRPINGVAAFACEAKGCGCEAFTDADPDDDWSEGDDGE